MIYFLKRMLPFLLLFLACKDINDKTVEEIINKSIEVSGLTIMKLILLLILELTIMSFLEKTFIFLTHEQLLRMARK